MKLHKIIRRRIREQRDGVSVAGDVNVAVRATSASAARRRTSPAPPLPVDSLPIDPMPPVYSTDPPVNDA
jgi:hypothetical protein